MHAGDFSIEVGRNICHGSDSVDSANREIGLWCVRCVRSIAGGVVCVGGGYGALVRRCFRWIDGGMDGWVSVYPMHSKCEMNWWDMDGRVSKRAQKTCRQSTDSDSIDHHHESINQSMWFGLAGSPRA